MRERTARLEEETICAERRGDTMGDVDRLRRLLDGDVDHGDLAVNPMLASIAERAYGISVKPMEMSKPSQLSESTDEAGVPAPSSANPLDLMVEVVEGGPAQIPQLGSGLPPLAPMPARKSKLFSGGLITLLALQITNIFGLFGMLFGDICNEPIGSAGTCPADGATKIVLLSIGQINTGWGWSEPIQNGVVGIPDIVAIVVLMLGLFAIKMRK